MYDQDIEELRASIKRVEHDFAKRVAQVESDSQEADAELHGKVAHVAVSSIRAQMIGLILVGFGSVLTVVG